MTWAEQCFALLPTHHPAAMLLTLIQTYPNWDISHSDQMCDNQSGDDRLAKMLTSNLNLHSEVIFSASNILISVCGYFSVSTSHRPHLLSCALFSFRFASHIQRCGWLASQDIGIPFKPSFLCRRAIESHLRYTK